MRVGGSAELGTEMGAQRPARDEVAVAQGQALVTLAQRQRPRGGGHVQHGAQLPTSALGGGRQNGGRQGGDAQQGNRPGGHRGEGFHRSGP